MATSENSSATSTAQSSKTQIPELAKGDRVILSRVRHEEYCGQIGAVTKTIKSTSEVIVRLESGVAYRANVENVDRYPVEVE